MHCLYVLYICKNIFNRHCNNNQGRRSLPNATVRIATKKHTDELLVTFLCCSVDMFSAVRSGVHTAGDSRRWRVKKLFFHIGFFDEHARGPQQNNTIEHLQGDHSAHKHTSKNQTNITNLTKHSTKNTETVCSNLDIYPR